MRMYKRIAIVASIFIIMATLNVYAATTGITLKSSVEEVKIGDTVTITIAAKCDSGIEGLESTLTYDKTKLELTTQAGSTALEGYMDISGVDGATEAYRPSVLYTGSGNAPTEADLITLGFKVLNTVAAGETLTIGLTGSEIGDSGNNWEEIQVLDVSLKVVGESNNDNEDDSITDDNNNSDEENNNDNDNNTDDSNNDNEDNDSTNNNNSDAENNNNNNNSNEENTKDETTKDQTNGEKDNTTVNTIIPAAGKSGLIILGIIALVMISNVVKSKINKYKDI